MENSPALFDQIIAELKTAHEADAQSRLVQFAGLISAWQYKRLYYLTWRHVPEGSNVLDWGCGNGHFSYFLVRCGYPTSAYEFENPNLKILDPFRNRSLYCFFPGQTDNPFILPFPDNSFSAVFSVGVLEHVRETGGNEAASLREIHRVLKPGGKFICYHFPNQYSYIEALAALVPGRHHHRFRYTKSVIRTLCREAGLRMMLLERYAVLPRNVTGSLPGGLRGSEMAASFYEALDRILQYPFSPICQNYLFVAVKI